MNSGSNPLLPPRPKSGPAVRRLTNLKPLDRLAERAAGRGDVWKTPMIRTLGLLSVLCAAILFVPDVQSQSRWRGRRSATPATPPMATGYGAVDYSYNIGTYDVTVGQYVAFLNANDPTGANPLGHLQPKHEHSDERQE